MIINETKNKTIVEQEHIITNAVAQGFGLMFRPKVNDGYIFKFDRFIKSLHIHTCFMLFKLDVIFLDENKKVLKVERDIPPFSFLSCGCKYMIELASGKADDVHKGDVLEW